MLRVYLALFAAGLLVSTGSILAKELRDVRGAQPSTDSTGENSGLTQTDQTYPSEPGDELVILNRGAGAALNTENILMPGDSIYFFAKGPNQITATLKLDDRGRCELPFLQEPLRILGYLTISEAISHIKSALTADKAGDYIIQIKKLTKIQGTANATNE